LICTIVLQAATGSAIEALILALMQFKQDETLRTNGVYEFQLMSCQTVVCQDWMMRVSLDEDRKRRRGMINSIHDL
jgi:hypothetical protein